VKNIFLSVVSLALGAACLFFAWYTLRLAWVNLTMQDAARHRQTGMLIGAIVFPVAAILFGYLCRRCWKLRRQN
jgi:biotin transporter BioY